MTSNLPDNSTFSLKLDEGMFTLHFLDFYQFVEEFFRNQIFEQLDWFALPGTVIVKQINSHSVEQAANALIERGYFNHIRPDSTQKNADLKQNLSASVLFPEWYSNDQNVQLQIEDKGFLENVLVKVGDDKYGLQFEDCVSFTQSFAINARAGEVYSAEPGKIIVSKVNVEIIEKAVNWLSAHNFFVHFKPLAK